ncbi:hypothetical protein ACFL6U_11615 [Planctomycetota bacterium]
MDLKKPDMKALLAKLSFMRNHLNMLVPVIIAMVAIVPIVLAGVVGGRLRGKMESESVRTAQTLQSLTRAAVPFKQAEAAQARIQEVAEDANAIEFLTKQSTMRPLLSTQIFPKPKDASQLIFEAFAKNYTQGIDEMITRIDGRDCPSEAELGDHDAGGGAGGMGMGMEGYGGGEMMGMEDYAGYGDGGYGAGGYGEGGGYGMTGMQPNKILDTICEQRAKSMKVYVNPFDIAGYIYWQDFVFETEDLALEACWYWQVGYWIMEDVFDTVQIANQDAINVFNAPIKRVMFAGFGRPPGGLSSGGFAGGGMGSMDYMTDYMTMGGETSTTSGDASWPTYVMKPSDGLLASYTQRVCTEEMDIVHFGLSMVVDAKEVLNVMDKLCSAKTHRFRGFENDQPEQVLRRNQITILESQAQPLRRKMGPHRLYRYGEDAAVELRLICEYIFDLPTYQKIVPEIVTSALLEGEG